MDTHHIRFMSLPTVQQKTRTAHQIGGTIAAKHVNLNRSELHSGTNQGFGDLIESDKYSQRSSFYILSPATAIEIMLGRYGADIAKKFTQTIRCALLAFSYGFRDERISS